METNSELLPLIADSNERFRMIRELGSGTYGRVMLALDRDLQQRCALKILQKSTTKQRDFQREYNYSLLLSTHRSIITTYEDRCFQTPDAYVLVQEYAPLGDLFESIPPQRGLPERAVKIIIKQVASALEFMHDNGLCKRTPRKELQGLPKVPNESFRSHQTLLSCVPTPTLFLTTQKILINIVRLMKYILEQLNKTSCLPISTEKDYLKFIHDNIPELRHVLDNRRIYIDKMSSTNNDQLFPICIFQEYLLNGINFLYYINKIDGIYSTTRKIVVEKCE
ncbi:unnamed protein product [Rotaria sp. Silwood2]|nr:unnamed protein product [Rotaria sp. Silwood2]